MREVTTEKIQAVRRMSREAKGICEELVSSKEKKEDALLRSLPT